MMLGEYLAAPRPPFDFIHSDCCRWIDRWVVHAGYPSPMEATAISYDSERSALRTIRRGGGLVSLWSAGMAAAGVEETERPKAGDVGVIARATVCGLNEALGIWTGGRWASLGLRGIDFAPADALRVWRV